MDALFNKNPLTIQFGEEAKLKKAAIDDDERKKAVDEKEKELKAIDEDGRQLVSVYQNLTVKDEDGEEAKKIRALTAKRALVDKEFQSLKQEFFEFKKKRTKEINQEMALKMREILNDIIKLIGEYAAQHGYDVVYETSGYTNTGLQVLVYVKPGISTDITEEILKLLMAKK